MDTGIVESLTKRTSKCLVAMFLSLRLAKTSEIVRRMRDYDFLLLLVKIIQNDFCAENLKHEFDTKFDTLFGLEIS